LWVPTVLSYISAKIGVFFAASQRSHSISART
jgi:hypothetical protein